MSNEAANSRYWIPMVGHTFRALEVIADAHEELSLQEIATRAGVNKSSAFRILFTLEKLGYLNRNPQTGKYQLGLKILESAQKARASFGVIQVAHPLMEALQQKFGETVNLAILQNNQLVYLEIIEGRHAFRMTGNAGARAPLHASAVGKAIAAFLPDAALKPLLETNPLARLTANTITNRSAMRKVLVEVRQQGYALDNEEVELGAFCIAAPIFSNGSHPLHALSLSGPTPRMRAQQKAIIKELTKTCAGISRQLML